MLTRSETLEMIEDIEKNFNEPGIDEKIITFLENYNLKEVGTISNFSWNMEEIIYKKVYKSLDINGKIKFLKKYMNLFRNCQVKMMEDINESSIETRKECLKFMYEDHIAIYINGLKNDEEKMYFLPSLKKSDDIISVIDTLSVENKIKCSEYFEKDYQNIQIIYKFTPEERKRFVQNTNNKDLKVKTIVKMLKEKEVETEELLSYIKNIEDTNAKALIIANVFSEEREYILSEMEITLQDKENITNKINIIDEMAKKNEDIYFFLDYKMLEDRYLTTLGKDKINQISCYPEIEYLFLQLKEKELEILKRCINNHLKSTQSDDWTEITKDIVDNIVSKKYKELIDDIEEIDNIDIDKLTKLLQIDNIFNIKTVKEFNDYEKIKNQVCDKYIESDNIEDKKLAICEKFFGHNLEYAKEIVEKYGEEIEELPDSNIKDYVISLKLLIETDYPKKLEEIYKEGKETLFIDKNYIKRELRNEFCKMYNADLLHIKDTKKLTENIYEVQGDFSMIVHSVGAYVENKIIINYKEDWNRKKIESQYFSTSYISSNKIKLAPINTICYGFVDMEEDSLAMAGATDLYTKTKSFIPEVEAQKSKEKYYTPEELVKKTGYIANELLYRRFQKGEYKKPEYIVVLKINGEIEEELMKNAQKASEDWKDEHGNNMPIVIIDVNRYKGKNKEDGKRRIKEDRKKREDNTGAKLHGIENIRKYLLECNEDREERD